MVWAKLALICPEKYFKSTSFELWSLGHLPICSCCFNIEEGAAVINNTGNTVLNFLGYYISWKCVLLINDKYWGQKKRVRRRLIFLLASEDFHVVVAFFLLTLKWGHQTESNERGLLTWDVTDLYWWSPFWREKKLSKKLYLI